MNVPHIPQEDKKVKSMRFRVTEAEYKRIIEQAKLRGYEHYSDYIRALIEKDRIANVEPPFNCIGEEMI